MPAERVVLVCGSGVPLDDFAATPEISGEPLVILPARLIWEKGVWEFAEAARRLHKQGVRARFALIGDTRASNPHAVPQSQLNAWVEEGCVEWWGGAPICPASMPRRT